MRQFNIKTRHFNIKPSVQHTTGSLTQKSIIFVELTFFVKLTLLLYLTDGLVLDWLIFLRWTDGFRGLIKSGPFVLNRRVCWAEGDRKEGLFLFVWCCGFKPEFSNIGPRSLIYSICVLTVASNNEKSLSSCQSSTKLLSTIEASRSKILLLTSLSSRSSSSRFVGFLRSLSVKEFRSLSKESRLSNKSISSLIK